MRLLQVLRQGTGCLLNSFINHNYSYVFCLLIYIIIIIIDLILLIKYILVSHFTDRFRRSYLICVGTIIKGKVIYCWVLRTTKHTENHKRNNLSAKQNTILSSFYKIIIVKRGAKKKN